MRYGKWHIEHITLPHAARVGLHNLSAETHAALLSGTVFLFVWASTCRKVQQSGGPRREASGTNPGKVPAIRLQST